MDMGFIELFNRLRWLPNRLIYSCNCHVRITPFRMLDMFKVESGKWKVERTRVLLSATSTLGRDNAKHSPTATVSARNP